MNTIDNHNFNSNQQGISSLENINNNNLQDSVFITNSNYTVMSSNNNPISGNSNLEANS